MAAFQAFRDAQTWCLTATYSSHWSSAETTLIQSVKLQLRHVMQDGAAGLEGDISEPLILAVKLHKAVKSKLASLLCDAKKLEADFCFYSFQKSVSYPIINTVQLFLKSNHNTTHFSPNECFSPVRSSISSET